MCAVVHNGVMATEIAKEHRDENQHTQGGFQKRQTKEASQKRTSGTLPDVQGPRKANGENRFRGDRMTITIQEGRYTGTVEEDSTTGARWKWTIHECLFPGNKHADPDVREHTTDARWPAKIACVADCMAAIMLMIAEDKRVEEALIAKGPRKYKIEDFIGDVTA